MNWIYRLGRYLLEKCGNRSCLQIQTNIDFVFQKPNSGLNTVKFACGKTGILYKQWKVCSVVWKSLPYSDIEMGPAPIRGQLAYSFARSRFVHNNLFQTLPSPEGEAKRPVIGYDKSKEKSQS